jgi:transposase
MGIREGAIGLTVQERTLLQATARASDQSARASVRATVILISAEGTGAQAIARTLGIGLRTVRLTRRRWRREDHEGLFDKRRSGRPPQC